MLIPKEKSFEENAAFWKEFPNRIDEAKVKPYTLPDPLKTFDGKKITTKEEYLSLRRPELLQFYQEKLYGFRPPLPDHLEVEVTLQNDSALNGAAVRRNLLVTCRQDDGRSRSFPVLLYTPKGQEGPFPVIVNPNFYGNHTVSPEEDIPISDHWLPYQWRKQFVTMEMRAQYRGSRELSDRAFVQGAGEALKRGYAVATFCYEYMMPDNGYHFEHSIYQLFHDEYDYMSEKRDYGSIGAWSWGISRVIDALENFPEILTEKSIVLGHSRLGKTALWTGVLDERIALTISNNSGCCGAKLFHRDFGETLKFMAYFRPFWYSLGIQEYADDEFNLPVDQHELIGMIAPRAVYIASASDDFGADPKGEFLAAWHAGKVYELFGLKGLDCPEEFPEPDTVIQNGSIAYHLRPGKHSLTFYDWERYLDYADKVVR